MDTASSIACMALAIIASFVLGCRLSKLVHLSIKVGSKVFHKKYGAGVVISRNVFDNWEVEFDYQHTDLAGRLDDERPIIIRRNCIEFFEPHSKELYIIKKAA